jgi:outer membrane protein assembly factor BamB
MHKSENVYIKRLLQQALKIYLILQIIIFFSLGLAGSKPFTMNSLISGDNLRNKEANKYNSNDFNIIIGTFLGNNMRNYYGEDAPSEMNVIWKLYLGKGKTTISRKLGEREWEGAGWTGQPLLVKEDDELYLVQGAYDHNLKKINANTGEIIWQYKFDDVVKGTGSIWHNLKSSDRKNSLVILQGSRLGLGNYIDVKHIPSYRAISYFTGKELWRLDVKWTDSYSRDADASALVINDTAYVGLENALFTVFNPDYKKAVIIDNMLQPEIFQEIKLYNGDDVIAHKNNVVTEASPCLLNDKIYIASGSGHVFGYDLKKKEIVWDFYIGSDIDGTPVVTSDNCLLITIEKQYINGKGGAFKLDPSKNPENAVVWFFPTDDNEYLGWEGGIIGSAGVNDYYNHGRYPYLAAFAALDGYLYIVNHMFTEDEKKVAGPNEINFYSTPELVFKKYIGPSICTPVIVENKIVAASYSGIGLFSYDEELNFNHVDSMPCPFESTPIVYNRKIFIASRNGYFYCLGNN